MGEVVREQMEWKRGFQEEGTACKNYLEQKDFRIPEEMREGSHGLKSISMRDGDAR